MPRDAEPKRAGSAEVQAIVAAVDEKGGSEAAGAAGEIEKTSGVAISLHQFDAVKGFEGANEDGRGCAGRFADNVEHEVRAVIEKDVRVALREIHRTNAGSGAPEVMTGRIARRIGFGFHDAAAEAPDGKVVDDDFADEETRESYGVLRKFRAAETADGKFWD
jgi:hypothetical protein